MAKRPNSVIEAEVIEDFERVRLADVADVIRGVTYKKDDARSKPETGLVPVLRANNIQDGALELDGELVYVPSELIGKEQLLREGDIVIATSSGSKDLVGKAAPVRTRWMGSFGAFCAAVRPREDIDPLYLAHFFEGPEYKALIRDKALGVNINNLRRGDLEELSIPLAPLPQQRRIVEAIELQLGRLDAAVARLQGAKARLKRYKQAVLKAAVEGRLTDPELADGEYPKDWRLIAIKDLAELLNGDRGKNYPSSKHYVPKGVPFINTGHIEPNGRLSQARMNYISRERFNILNAGKIVRGDIVYCLRGATLGKTAIVDLDEGAIASSLMIIRLQEEVSREFIYYYLTSDLGRRNIIDYDNGTAQPNLSAKSVGKYLVPLPPIEEQLRLVAHVRERLVQVENLEATLDAQLQQAVRLRQAVLKRAFEGRLVTTAS